MALLCSISQKGTMYVRISIRCAAALRRHLLWKGARVAQTLGARACARSMASTPPTSAMTPMGAMAKGQAATPYAKIPCRSSGGAPSCRGSVSPSAMKHTRRVRLPPPSPAVTEEVAPSSWAPAATPFPRTPCCCSSSACRGLRSRAS